MRYSTLALRTATREWARRSHVPGTGPDRFRPPGPGRWLDHQLRRRRGALWLTPRPSFGLVDLRAVALAASATRTLETLDPTLGTHLSGLAVPLPAALAMAATVAAVPLRPGLEGWARLGAEVSPGATSCALAGRGLIRELVGAARQRAGT
jgi:hypothetical protein